MKKTILAMTLIGAIATPTHAAFWDDWFGDSNEETATPAVPQATANITAPAKAPTANVTSTVAALIPSLTSQLGVSDNQAKGGMGALLQLAQSNLSGDEFGQLGKTIPNIQSLLAAAPSLNSGGQGSQVAGLLSQAGTLGTTLSGAAKLTSQFEALGLSPEMIGQFASILMGLFSSDNGTSSLLQKGLGAILA